MRCERVHQFPVLLLVLLLSVVTSATDDGYKNCERIVKKWASFSADSEVSDDKHALRDLLFFLHVPRTGGRAYYQCFLKKLYGSSLECPRSYDKLRYDPRESDCRLLTTHDDYSLTSKLRRERTSVMTILRDPIQRVLSSYEFSVEVASRFLIYPNLTTAERMGRLARNKTSRVSTLDIWPWKYLVPWMREDLFARRDVRELRGPVRLATTYPYDMEDVVMPLREYINGPVTRDNVHNGATFQIVGLTNNSYFSEAHEVRRCVLEHHSLGEYVLRVAKKKLDNMLYVGLTENHKESAKLFANMVAAQVISKQEPSNSNSEQGSSSKTDYETIDKSNGTYRTRKNASSIGEDKPVHEKLTVHKLMEAYNSCILTIRKTQNDRRVNSLKQISANFTEEARRKVPESLIHEIALYNGLDIELYKYGQQIFEKQQTRSVAYDGGLTVSAYRGFYGDSVSWKYLFLAVTGVMLLVFILIFVNSRRRSSKVKM